MREGFSPSMAMMEGEKQEPVSEPSPERQLLDSIGHSDLPEQYPGNPPASRGQLGAIPGIEKGETIVVGKRMTEGQRTKAESERQAYWAAHPEKAKAYQFYLEKLDNQGTVRMLKERLSTAKLFSDFYVPNEGIDKISLKDRIWHLSFDQAVQRIKELGGTIPKDLVKLRDQASERTLERMGSGLEHQRSIYLVDEIVAKMEKIEAEMSERGNMGVHKYIPKEANNYSTPVFDRHLADLEKVKDDTSRSTSVQALKKYYYRPGIKNGVEAPDENRPLNIWERVSRLQREQSQEREVDQK